MTQDNQFDDTKRGEQTNKDPEVKSDKSGSWFTIRGIQSITYTLLLTIVWMSHKDLLLTHPDLLIVTVIILVLHTGFYNNPHMQAVLAYFAARSTNNRS